MFFNPRLEETSDVAFRAGWVLAVSALPECFLDTTPHQVWKGEVLELLPVIGLAQVYSC